MRKLLVSFAIVAALASAITAADSGGAQTTPPAKEGQQARIKLDTDRTIGEVHPHVFGNFAEHLGRMIYGGIYEEGSPLSDADGFRKDVMDAIRPLGVSILRWPGGNFVSTYNWQDGIGPKDQRPVRAEPAWGTLESNRFGTDEFLRYAERIGAEPYVCINLGFGTLDDARYWIEYTNEARKTYWSDQRRKNGRTEPWKVKYWGLGNELDGPWQLGQKSAHDYTLAAREAAKAMRRVDGDIKLIASGSSDYAADWIDWNRTVVNELRDYIDYIAIHTYIGNRENDFERFMGWSQTIDHYIEVTAGLIKQAQSGQREPRPIHIAYDEWNVWYRAGGKEQLEETYNFEDALAMGLFFNSFFRHADVVKMANLAQMVNVIAPIMTNKQGLFLQPTYFPLVEYGKQRGNTALDVWVSAPTYQIDKRPQLAYLDVSSTYNPKTRELFVNVLNRSKDRDLTTRIENQTGELAPEAAIWELNHPDLKATHTFGDDQKVRPVTRNMSLTIADGGFSYTFPAHSLTIVRLKLQ
jgi:alpha-N-arabinofuranosidase